MVLLKINQDHYVVVTDEPIQIGNYFLNTIQKEVYCNDIENYDVNKNYLKKITHSTKPLEDVMGYDSKGWVSINPIDLSYIKSLVGEVDVWDKAEERYPISMQPNGRTIAGGVYNVDVNFMERIAYKHGYNQCKEDKKDKRFSEEDMINFVKFYIKGGATIDVALELYKSSLTQPKDTWECEFIDGQLKLK